MPKGGLNWSTAPLYATSQGNLYKTVDTRPKTAVFLSNRWPLIDPPDARSMRCSHIWRVLDICAWYMTPNALSRMILQLSRMCFVPSHLQFGSKLSAINQGRFKLVSMSPSVVQCCFLKVSRRADLGFVGQKQPHWPHPWWAVLGCQGGLVERPDAP